MVAYTVLTLLCKCIFLCIAFEDKKVVTDATYDLYASCTTILNSHPTPFIGMVLANVPRSTCQHYLLIKPVLKKEIIIANSICLTANTHLNPHLNITINIIHQFPNTLLFVSHFSHYTLTLNHVISLVSHTA